MKSVLDNLRDCTGCGACAAACGSGAITFHPDQEGFLVPVIAQELCTDCGACQRTCPSHPEHPLAREMPEPISVLAGWHLDDSIRRRSSSGGVFGALAESVLGNGGAVVGAALDDTLGVIHILVEDIADLERLRGSKYVQSRITTSLYREIRDRLKRKQSILFSGTPCQVAGLRRYLRTIPPELILCDIVCHGTPSPSLWAAHLKHLSSKGNEVAEVNFRDKFRGWSRSGPAMQYTFRGGSTQHVATLSDPYVVAFLRDISLRECCYRCPYARIQRTGDLSLADFWGISKFQPQYDLHDEGTSLIIASSEKGLALLQTAQDRLFTGESSLEFAFPRNPMLTRPSFRLPARDRFYKDLQAFGWKKTMQIHQLNQTLLGRKIRMLRYRIRRAAGWMLEVTGIRARKRLDNAHG